ncbi:unnamed protein product [Effrenium voratum]|nr:unnamed protein product [Effrenium voratum]
MAELEHAIHQNQLQRQLDKDKAASSAVRLIAGSVASFAKFLSGPSEAKSPKLEKREECRSEASSPSSPLHVEKVVLRLPENCERSLMTKDMAEKHCWTTCRLAFDFLALLSGC